MLSLHVSKGAYSCSPHLAYVHSACFKLNDHRLGVACVAVHRCWDLHARSSAKNLGGVWQVLVGGEVLSLLEMRGLEGVGLKTLLGVRGEGRESTAQCLHFKCLWAFDKST